MTHYVEDDDAWAERFFQRFGHDTGYIMQTLKTARADLRRLRDEVDQQRTRAEAAEAELAEMRKAIADVDLTGADRRNELLDDMSMIEHPAPYRYEPKTSLPPVNDEDDGA